MNKIQVIYIIGAGRSGTTLLDIVLGNQSGIFSAGELNRFSKRNGVPHSARDDSVSDLWEQVNEGFEYPPNNFHGLCEEMEYHSAGLKLPFISKTKIEKYSNYNITLFNNLKKNISPDSVIVDSSKYPMRAYRLSKIFRGNIKYIYVKRSPFKVVNSFQKKSVEQPSKSRFSANLYLLLVNMLAGIILTRLAKNHKTVTITYEGLTNQPVPTIQKIEKALSLDLSDIKQKLRLNKELSVGKLFDGNRLRLEKTIKIIESKKDPKESPKSLIDRVFFPLHKIFWYNQK